MIASSDKCTAISGLTGPQKLAALLVILGGEAASQILKQLTEREIEVVSAEMAKLNVVSAEMRTEILREFGSIIVSSTGDLRGGAEFAQTALEKAVGGPRAAGIMNRVAPSRGLSPSVAKIAEIDAGQIVNVLRLERPQTIALLTSCLPTRKASEVLRLLPDDLREQTVERIATLDVTPVETVERVAQVVLQKIGPQSVRALSQPGGLTMTASILNALDRRLSHPLLASLETRNPELAQALREKMFTFDDMAKLTSTALQRILREVDLRELATALKSCGEEVETAILSCISKRAAETVREEMSYMTTVKQKEIDGARLRIISVVRQLESDGEIELPSSNEQEALA